MPGAHSTGIIITFGPAPGGVHRAMHFLQHNQSTSAAAARLAACLATLALARAGAAQPPAADQPPAAPLSITTSAEIERKRSVDGRSVVELVPANRVVAGDLVIYTLEVRNVSGALVALPQFTVPIPEHMRYVADSAAGPGADISYSVDGGRRFDKPQNLDVTGADGRLRRALPGDYTHIRWVLKHGLKPNSVAFARFRAVLN